MLLVSSENLVLWNVMAKIMFAKDINSGNIIRSPILLMNNLENSVYLLLHYLRQCGYFTTCMSPDVKIAHSFHSFRLFHLIIVYFHSFVKFYFGKNSWTIFHKINGREFLFSFLWNVTISREVRLGQRSLKKIKNNEGAVMFCL